MSDLPPLDQPQAWVVVRGSEQAGPYTLDLLINEVVAGRLAETTPIWWPGLADWTTMAGHPSVAVEIASRRGSSAAPGWAPEPAPAPAPAPAQPGFTQPVTAQPAAAQPAAADPIRSVPESGYGPTDAPTLGATGADFAIADSTIADSTIADSTIADSGVADGEIIDVPAEDVGETGDSSGDDHMISDAEVIESRDLNAVHAPGGVEDLGGVFDALVHRSAERAERIARIGAVDDAFVYSVVAAAQRFGFGLDERLDLDRGHELRFGESNGSLLVVSMGIVSATRPEDVRSGVVPITVSYRIGKDLASTSSGPVAGDEHGAVSIHPDEWTGQTTGSISLVLGVDDYVGDDLDVDADRLGNDVASVVQTVTAAIT